MTCCAPRASRAICGKASSASSSPPTLRVRACGPGIPRADASGRRSGRERSSVCRRAGTSIRRTSCGSSMRPMRPSCAPGSSATASTRCTSASVTPDGQVHWIAAQGTVEPDARGKLTLVRGVVRDVTQQRQAEDEAAELRRKLAHAGRVTMLGQLSSALAHELSQPLSAIQQNAETAQILLSARPGRYGGGACHRRRRAARRPARGRGRATAACVAQAGAACSWRRSECKSSPRMCSHSYAPTRQ